MKGSPEALRTLFQDPGTPGRAATPPDPPCSRGGGYSPPGHPEKAPPARAGSAFWGGSGGA
eukprot:10708645-Alexandrium_andersonii.AAC.1